MEWTEKRKQEELAIKMEHLMKYFDFNARELDDISLYYQGKGDLESLGVKRLFAVSEQLCNEWNMLATNPANKSKENGRKNYLLKRLFPRCPGISYIRRGLQLVIGNVRIENSVFLNVNAKFGYNTDVYIGHNAQFGPNVRIQETPGERKTAIIGAGVWFGGGVTYLPGINVGENSVVGAGGFVNEDIPSGVLALGRPAKVKRPIEKGEMFSIPEEKVLSDEEIETARAVMKTKKCGAPGGLYSKVLRGKGFSTASISLGFLYLRTHALCRRLDDPTLTPKQREEIIDELFPIHGKNIVIGKNFFMDLIGIVALGDNVVIGDNVSLGGLVRLGNDVNIGSNCVLFASNHPLDVAKRGFGFHKGLGLSVPIVYTTIEVQNGVSVGENSIVAPKCKLNQNVPNDSLVLANGKTIPLPKE